MIAYQPFELHCHTRHSDGQFTVPGLMRAVADYGYAGFALTDHNAVSGGREITPELEAQTCKAIRGIEWTTFFGHLLVLGGERYVDWRFVTPDTIDQALVEIRAAGSVAGIAHPCEVGAPLMCGCNWEFHVTRWDLVDYVEIWSQEDPMTRAKNDLARPWYDALLNAGQHLAVSAGRDWHGPDPAGKIPLLTATYLGVDGEVTQQGALDALRHGRTYVTLGPTMDVKLRQRNHVYGLGETVSPGEAELSICVEETERREIWGRNGIGTDVIRVVANGRILAELPYTGAPVTLHTDVEAGWLRVEVYGHDATRTGLILALSSPIYIENAAQ